MINNTTQALERLSRLLSQNEFEPFFPEDNTIGIIYMMNDAAESYFLLHDATMTGTYNPDYEGELDADLLQEDGRYVLIVHQDDSVVSLFFSDITYHENLYDYGNLAHMWMKGDEDLRLIEFRIAHLHDKYLYLDESAVNELEAKLVPLHDFPPLNHLCYPSVPEKYQVYDLTDWSVTEEAIATMEDLSRDAGDDRMLSLLRKYRSDPSKRVARKIAWELREIRHDKLMNLIYERIREATSMYEKRVDRFDDPIRSTFSKKIEQAKQREQELRNAGIRCQICYQEPFLIRQDGIELEVYLLVWQNHMHRRLVHVERM